MTTYTPGDEAFMRRAMELAARGVRSVEPNPAVGAVLVRDGVVVGEGFHEAYGQAHAEANALRAAGEKARGATLYVTLEPCAHQGKTPPCALALAQAGVARVVAAAKDPNPLVAGKGFAVLRAAGIPWEAGLLEGESRRLNAAFFKFHETGEPYVTAKWAMTLDGKIATAAGESRWITDAGTREFARTLRPTAGAVVIGVDTAIQDNPRLLPAPGCPRPPLRVVCDSRGRLPLDSLLVAGAREVPVAVAATRRISAERAAALRAAGCEVLSCPEERGIQHVLVEGGGSLHASFFEAGLVDAVAVFIAPGILGGHDAISPVEGAGFPLPAQAPAIEGLEVRRIGPDLFVRGEIRRRPT
jgi:diaminohydroxyphosphoribosylaminopyrimidine deaminase/5-amino-6-(5-phosphoribosylamino)uracil reductase